MLGRDFAGHGTGDGFEFGPAELEQTYFRVRIVVAILLREAVRAGIVIGGKHDPLQVGRDAGVRDLPLGITQDALAFVAVCF